MWWLQVDTFDKHYSLFSYFSLPTSFHRNLQKHRSKNCLILYASESYSAYINQRSINHLKTTSGSYNLPVFPGHVDTLADTILEHHLDHVKRCQQRSLTENDFAKLECEQVLALVLIPSVFLKTHQNV